MAKPISGKVAGSRRARATLVGCGPGWSRRPALTGRERKFA